MVDFIEVMRQRGYQRGLIETHMHLDPCQILLAPGFPASDVGVTEEKLPSRWRVAHAELIFLSR